MKSFILPILILCLLSVSCGTPQNKDDSPVITVSIPPFEYFIAAVADSDFVINVMLPPGADHHSWEPLPGQIASLAGSEAFVINGRLGFEFAWMTRFREVNPEMKIIDISERINLIEPAGEEAHENHGYEHEGADPHYWMSPKEAKNIAAVVRDLAVTLKPSEASRYNENYNQLIKKIAEVDSTVTAMFNVAGSKTFMIYHPALIYMTRDYGIEQISFEDEGKDPSPARMKELVDLARSKDIKIIFVQAEYDAKSAAVLAKETGAELITINPMNSEWETAVIEVAEALSKY